MKTPRQLAALERTLKALANRRRLAIIVHLKQEKSASVGDIAEAINLSFKATSKHLSILLHTDIVEKEQRSLLVFYKLSDAAPSLHKQLISLL